MPIQATLVFTLLILTSPITAFSFSVPQLLEDKDVVIVGETHRRPESTQFVTNTVAEYLQGGKCLIVGLEIPLHQQPVLERTFLGVWRLNRIPISSSTSC